MAEDKKALDTLGAQVAKSPVISMELQQFIQAILAGNAEQTRKLVEALRAPTDEQVEARKLTDAKKRRDDALREDLRAQQREERENKRRAQSSCTHRNPRDQKSTLAAVHNFPDQYPRGTCLRCYRWIEPPHVYNLHTEVTDIERADNALLYRIVLEKMVEESQL